MSKRLGIVLAKENSQRFPKKSLKKLCGKEMFLYPCDILKVAKCDHIIVSTDSNKIRDISHEYGVNGVVMRQTEWSDEEIIGNTLKKYEKITGQNFDVCAVLTGVAVFWSPSWIRMGFELLRDTKFKYQGDKITYVYPCDSAVSGMCIKIHEHKLVYKYGFPLPHFGLNIDIDYPEDFELAEQVMATIQRNDISRNLNETIHETPNRIKHILKRSNQNLPSIWACKKRGNHVFSSE